MGPIVKRLLLVLDADRAKRYSGSWPGIRIVIAYTIWWFLWRRG